MSGSLAVNHNRFSCMCLQWTDILCGYQACVSVSRGSACETATVGSGKPTFTNTRPLMVFRSKAAAMDAT